MKVEPPKRAQHTYTQRLAAPPASVFPLLCPVREAEWLERWNPIVVKSRSGLAEPDCVFVTDAAPHPHRAIWYVTRHEPERHFVEMIKITPELTACRLSIDVRAAGTGSEAVVTYCHTSLGPLGDAFVETFTAEHYLAFMRDWEARLNHFLRHGTMLRDR